MSNNLIGEFHADHAKVVQAFMHLREAIQQQNPAEVMTTLSEANKMVGPHFKFEENFLYPSLEEFLGAAGVQRLVAEHDGVFRGVAALLDLATKKNWNDSDAHTATAYLDLIWEHPITCDGLSLYIERLPEQVQNALFNQMEKLRREGTTLLDYRSVIRKRVQ